MTNLQPQCQWWSDEVMEEKVGLDCQACRMGRPLERWGPPNQSSHIKLCPAILPSCQGFACSPGGFAGQSSKPSTHFEYILPFIDDADWCVFLGSVYWLFHLQLAQFSPSDSKECSEPMFLTKDREGVSIAPLSYCLNPSSIIPSLQGGASPMTHESPVLMDWVCQNLHLPITPWVTQPYFSTYLRTNDRKLKRCSSAFCSVFLVLSGFRTQNMFCTGGNMHKD